MTDGAGQTVTPEKAAEAVKWFAEMWGNALFDCGPQDYEHMAKKCIEAFELVDQLEDELDLPEVRRRLNDPTVPWEQVKKELGL
jgi:hypothetical protein